MSGTQTVKKASYHTQTTRLLSQLKEGRARHEIECGSEERLNKMERKYEKAFLIWVASSELGELPWFYSATQTKTSVYTAIETFHKALTEHHNLDTLKKLNEG
ncbi:hypothetical protein Fmac_008601 [Flemingia macrophylla]|uniref:Uncharacterized protein n=1 Tax=Flemingia macrophylla TaxID=520843 RepID=A0ABD1MXV0_9FABA